LGVGEFYYKTKIREENSRVAAVRKDEKPTQNPCGLFYFFCGTALIPFSLSG